MDQNLKHRLTGAVVLVSLAVIFIPVILEGPDNEWTPISQGMPEAPQPDYRAPVGLPDKMAIPAPITRNRQDIDKPVYKLDKPARSKAIEPSPEPVQYAPVEWVSEFADGWYVQVGSFSRELNADGLRQRLEVSGHEVSYQRTPAGSSFTYRVLVGPRSSRGQAQLLRDELARDFQLEGILVNNPG